MNNCWMCTVKIRCNSQINFKRTDTHRYVEMFLCEATLCSFQFGLQLYLVLIRERNRQNKCWSSTFSLHCSILLWPTGAQTQHPPSVSWLSGCPQRFLHPAGFTPPPPPSVPRLQRDPILAPVIMVVHLMKRLHTESNHHDLPSLLPQEILLCTGFITPRLANSWIQFALIDCCETGQRGLVRGNKHISRFYNITQLSGDFWLWVGS